MLTSPVHVDDYLSPSPTISSATLEVEEVRLSVNSEVETTIYNAYSSISSSIKPHATSNDPCWNAMRRVQTEVASLSLDDFSFIQKVGRGDIGSVYLVELKGNKGGLFAAKVMDKEELVSRSKEGRARTEREILEMLDHPFLPTLYTTLDTDKWSLLLTEFCPGGDLHVLRQRQPEKRFDEAAVRFYTSEVVVALEYLHMMGIIYRDLKPENVLDMECEKMDADVFSQQLLGDIYQSLENEVSNCQKMDKGALVQQVLDRIQSLEDEGLVDSYFQICYSLKEDSGPYFFLELIPSFLSDARTVMRDMAEALESPVVDFDVLIEHCIKLKGSSACLGACKITNVCSDFAKAVNKKSKDECLRLLRNINREYHDLQSKLESIMRVLYCHVYIYSKSFVTFQLCHLVIPERSASS